MTALGHEAAPLTEALVREALAHATPQQRAIDWLAQSLEVPAEQFGPLAADHFGLAWLSMDELHACAPDFDLVSFVEASQRGCIALRREEQTLLALSDPLDTRTRAWATHRLRERARDGVTWAFVLGADLRAYLAVAERSLRALDAVSLKPDVAGERASTALSVSIATINATESQIVRLVDSTIHDALKSDASDIHFETSAQGLSIKYRLDGVLVLIRSVEGLDAAHQALSRIKVVAELDIAERRVPQDGRIKVAIDGVEIDLRVSIMPNLFGEDAVLRILDRRHLTGAGHTLRLDNLGFDADTLAFIRDLAAAPHGLLLATGPTGSGKTTTLYAALTEVNTGLDKIITIEDPVEYQVPGVLQIPVNERKGLTFARGLRSILRHDPDKIMVGEIRDPETAQIAVQAALTGHQVFTSVHANNVFDVIGRFNTMGVDTYSFVSALSGIVAQRLVRLNCPRCVRTYQPPEAQVARAGIHALKDPAPDFRHGLGCAHCRGTGFKGRRAISERLPLTDSLRDLLSERAPLARIKQAARDNGYRSLRQAALAAALAGDTTLEEINRVTTSD
ncbi:MAG TPA: GspE/PulE family protein [Burkholderiaceae bacterium]|nr:GspE/PulE family protein [Burkholderiaceae bacterium]HQR72296.1 GspE/PulE family protein [Burkholderiaceae bacterium]